MTTFDGERDEEPPPALVAQQRGVGRADVSQQDALERPLVREPRRPVKLDCPPGCRLRQHVDVFSLRKDEGIREVVVLPEGDPRRPVPTVLVDLEIADHGAFAARVVVLEEDESTAVALEQERIT